jgi:hypothetical protein
MPFTGGCLCRAIRYEIAAGPLGVADYCHCTQCRRASGAPVVAWLQVAPGRFRLTAGAPRPYQSSSHSTRWFCPACGSPLYMTDMAQTSVGITLGSLDEPAAVAPTVHGWTSEQLAWLDIHDHLPRHPHAPPYDL